MTSAPVMPSAIPTVKTSPVAIEATELRLREGTRSLISSADLSIDETRGLINLARKWKAEPARFIGSLAGLHVAMLFEKPSLRTRVSFEVGLAKLGAHAVFLDHGNEKLGERETVRDYALNLERWVDAIVARVYSHDTLKEMSEHASVPVINALCDTEHPCQALADLMTVEEHLEANGQTLAGSKIAWVGDGNNVCHSLMISAAALGVSVTAVTPKGFEPSFEIVRTASRVAAITGAQITLTNDLKAVEGHHAVYTDKWVSMGQDHQTGLRTDAFDLFRVDEDVMQTASKGLKHPSLFMHCLPAKRGEEVTAGVLDGPHSVVYDQAENRMHAQNALLIWLLGSR